MLVVFFTLAVFFWPSGEDRLTKNDWCIERLVVNGQQQQLEYSGLVLQSQYSCDDYVVFNEEGSVRFSNGILGNWQINSDEIIISKMDEING